MIELENLTARQLLELISAASAELQRREREPKVAPSPEPPRPVVIAPIEKDRRFVEACIRLLKEGRYVKAEEKDEYRRITKSHPEWTKVEGYPESLRGSGADRWLAFNRR